MSSQLSCDALNKYLNPANLLKSSVPSALARAFIECYMQAGIGNKDFMSQFTREASRRLKDAYSCRNLKDILSEAYNKVKQVLDSYKGTKAIIQARLVSRLLIDTRNPYIPLEIGLAWDPYVNLPYIPSSAIKGVARSYFERYSIKIGDHTYDDLFGTQDREGLVIFLDAYPVACGSSQESLLDLDVITPHYNEVNNQIREIEAQPKPLVFLTVAPGTLFYVTLVTEIKATPQQIMELLNSVGKALEEGIGAKTALGYGSISVVSSSSYD